MAAQKHLTYSSQRWDKYFVECKEPKEMIMFTELKNNFGFQIIVLDTCLVWTLILTIN